MKHKRGAYQYSVIESNYTFYRNLSIIPLLLLFFLFFLPVITILKEAFTDQAGGLSFSSILLYARDPYIKRILGFTILQATISTIASLCVGIPGAYVLVNYRFRGKRFLRSLCTLPFVLPSILVVLGFVIFYGNNGIVNRTLMSLFSLSTPPLSILYTFGAIILAHTFYNFPIALGLIASYWEQLPVQCEHAAMTMGAHRWKIFTSITLPRIFPAILSASTLIFLFCFSSFVILLVLGGGPQFTTIEVEIFRRARITTDIPGAATLSIFSISIALFLIALHSWAQRMMNKQELVANCRRSEKENIPRTLLSRTLITVYIALTLCFVLGPLVGVIYRSFFTPISRSGGLTFSLQNYRQLFAFEHVVSSPLNTGLKAIGTSLIIAFITTGISLIMGLLLAARLRSHSGRKRLSIELFAMLPMAISSVIIGLGYYVIGTIIGNSQIIRYILVLLAHVVIVSPFVLRTILPAYRNIPVSISQASQTLGATVGQTFRKVEIPLLRSSLATGAAFACAISLGEVNATLILADSQLVTIPLAMYRLIGSYNFSGACALGTLLILFCTIIFSIIESVKKEL